MADVAIGLEHNASNVTRCLRDDINVGCVNCVLIKELCNALMDQKLLILHSRFPKSIFLRGYCYRCGGKVFPGR